MPSLAHEGNPKEDEITIQGGDVLSTAQLDINLTFVAGVTPPTANPNFATQSQSCSDVFEWAGQNENEAFLGSQTDTPWITLQDSGTSGGSIDRYYDQTLHLRINSTRTCYGVLWQKIEPLNFSPGVSPAAGSEVFFRVMFNGLIDGTPRCGPCVWVDDATTKEIAYLFALVADFDAGVTRLMRWEGGSLSNLAHGTQLATLVIPSIGDYMTIYVDQFPDSVGSNGVFAIVDTGSDEFLFDDDKPHDGSTTRHAKMGFGFVSIGGETAGKAEFKYAGVAIPNTAPFVIINNSGGT